MSLTPIEEAVEAKLRAATQKQERAAAKAEAKRLVQRERLIAGLKPVKTGVSDEGHWLELEDANVRLPTRALVRPLYLLVAGMLLGGASVVTAVVPGIVFAFGLYAASIYLGVRDQGTARALLVVTEGGYWAMKVRGEVVSSGRLEDLRLRFGDYREESPAHGYHYAYLRDAEGTVCDSSTLTAQAAAQVRAFAARVGIKN